MSELWGFVTDDDGNPTYSGKLIGYQGSEAVLQVWDATTFLLLGMVELTDEVKRVPREKLRTFLNAKACAEAVGLELRRLHHFRNPQDDYPHWLGSTGT